MSNDENTPKTDRILAAKQRSVDERRHLVGGPGSAERLPPGQHLVEKWPVLDLGIQPEIAREDWRLRCDGLVAEPVTLDLDEFLALPQGDMVSDIHCVTSWSRYDNHWSGVAARDLLHLVQPAADVRHVILHAYDGYTTNVPIEVFADDDVLLAHSWQGHPLSVEHGAPVRVVIPKRYFWKSAKWVCRLEFVAQDRPGFWEERGYHNEGDPWTEQRYS